MDKPLFLFVGKSASGKSAVANLLGEKYGYKQIWSYTTRPPRYENEPGHIFVSKEGFDNLGELAAYTLYDNYEYGTTFEQINEADIYVVDVPGVESLLKNLQDDKRPIVIIYFNASVYNRIHRMIDRHNCDAAIVSRLLEDERFDWLKKLDSLTWHYSNIIGKDVQLYPINANSDLINVVELVLYYMRQYTED